MVPIWVACNFVLLVLSVFDELELDEGDVEALVDVLITHGFQAVCENLLQRGMSEPYPRPTFVEGDFEGVPDVPANCLTRVVADCDIMSCNNCDLEDNDVTQLMCVVAAFGSDAYHAVVCGIEGLGELD